MCVCVCVYTDLKTEKAHEGRTQCPKNSFGVKIFSCAVQFLQRDGIFPPSMNYPSLLVTLPLPGARGPWMRCRGLHLECCPSEDVRVSQNNTVYVPSSPSGTVEILFPFVQSSRSEVASAGCQTSDGQFVKNNCILLRNEFSTPRHLGHPGTGIRNVRHRYAVRRAR